MRKPHYIDNPLREYRLKHFLLQQEISKRCGVANSMWSLVECQKRIPSLEMAYRISKRTGIPLEKIARFCLRRSTKAKAKVIRRSGVDLRGRIET